MCLPVIAAGLTAFGSIVQGVQANQAAQAQASALDQQAEAERRASAFEAANEFRKQQAVQANARAQVGASGVGFQGSPTEVLTANAGQGQLDLEAIKFGSTINQNNLRTQGNITRMQGKQALVGGIIGGATSFVSGISQYYDPKRAVRVGGSAFA